MAAVAEHAARRGGMALHGLVTLPFWLAAGRRRSAAWLFYLKAPAIPAALDRWLGAAAHAAREQVLLRLVQRKACSPRGARLLGTGLWKGGDQGADRRRADQRLGARASARLSGVLRRLQTGQLYWYALVMVVGIFGFLTWRLWPMLAHEHDAR